MKFVHGWTAVNSTQQQQDQQEQPKPFSNSAAMGGMAMDLSGRRLIPKLLRLPIPGSVLVLDKDTLRKNLNTAVLQMRNKQFMGRHPTTANSLDHGQSFWNDKTGSVLLEFPPQSDIAIFVWIEMERKCRQLRVVVPSHRSTRDDPKLSHDTKDTKKYRIYRRPSQQQQQQQNGQHEQQQGSTQNPPSRPPLLQFTSELVVTPSGEVTHTPSNRLNNNNDSVEQRQPLP
ncbi:hypothetical protein IV203_000055 [Nitzschia inconspicua]|uniref:Uncharacterized protein n=1 Tax=Nitzschia inconspicua TaxID=303405 RepID=A0A9K3L476_9STRA|nr:hypothetical protein IV203_000055 [Nitzschia inconspicua]